MTESFVKIIRKNANKVSRVSSVKPISFCMRKMWVIEEYFLQTLHITVVKDIIFDFVNILDTSKIWKFVFYSIEFLNFC